jgi:hypothetical protein
VLLVEAYHKIEQLAQERGADAYLQIPTGPTEFADAIKALIDKSTGVGDQRGSAE